MILGKKKRGSELQIAFADADSNRLTDWVPAQLNEFGTITHPLSLWVIRGGYVTKIIARLGKYRFTVSSALTLDADHVHIGAMIKLTHLEVDIHDPS